MCNCLNVSTIQWFLNAYNIIFLISGIILACLGLRELRSLEYTTQIHTAAIYLLLVAAGLMLLVHIMGCIAICRLSRCLLIWYAGLLMIVLLMEIVSGILCFFSTEYVKDELTEKFRITFMDEYGRNSLTEHRIDTLQRRLKCCGIRGFEDWADSYWKRDKPKDFRNVVPTSCCKSWSYFCAKWDIPNNIYYEGCTEVITRTIANNLSYISGIGLGICVIQLLGIILVLILHSRLKYFEIAKYKAYSLNRSNKYHYYDYS